MSARWACALVLAAVLVPVPSASADLPSLLGACGPRDALDDDNATRTLPYTFCDDGVPAAAGGGTPNPTAQSAIKVPSAYGGITGLPAPAASEAVPGEDPVDNTVALDVDVSLPDPAKYPVAGGRYPLVVMMHGCCGGSKTGWEGRTIDPGGAENWHYNNAWFASRGYIVLTYTARGFVDASNHGSTGQTELDSARYEINDYQHLAGQLADAGDLLPGAGEVRVDTDRVVPTGGSYGGGFTWLALTDPAWNSPGGAPMKVVAAATKYGWTNLVESLVPRGDDLRDALPETDPEKMKATIKSQVGVPKRSINAALYASGKTGVPPAASPHTTFPPAIDQAQLCLNSSDPFESNPLCTGTLQNELGRFIDERSAYYQAGFFAGLAAGTIDPVPVFSAGTFTDPLFPAPEHRRMVERLKSIRPGYPVQEFYGDYNHFVQNKRKEWADVCGADHHVCTYADYPGGDLNADPPGRALSPRRDQPPEPVHRPLRQAARQHRPAGTRVRRDRLAPGLSPERRPAGRRRRRAGPALHGRVVRRARAQPADGQRPRRPGHHQQGGRQPPRSQRPTRSPTRSRTAPAVRSRAHPAGWPAPGRAWPPTTPPRCRATSRCSAPPVWWCPTPGRAPASSWPRGCTTCTPTAPRC